MKSVEKEKEKTRKQIFTIKTILTNVDNISSSRHEHYEDASLTLHQDE